MDAEIDLMTLGQTRILESLSTAVVVFDAGLRILHLNPAAEALFAHSARHLRGLTLADLVADPQPLAGRLASALDEFRAFTERGRDLRLHNGKEITVDYTVTPQTEGGRDTLLIVELIRVDRHLRIAREETLLEQSQAMRQLVRGLAHEIKNPLGGLRGAAQLLERELDSEELREYTRIIIGEADRLRSLVNRMLGPKTLPNRQPTNIHEVLEHVRSLVLAEGGGIEIERDYDPSIPELLADADMLIQSVLNIVRNAAQALEGQGTITLRTRARRQFTIGQQRHRLVLSVEIIDNGPGIPEDMRETLFLPMVTGHAEGTGLGLSIAQSLVNLHGGLIECRSEPGETVFTLLLPLESRDE